MPSPSIFGQHAGKWFPAVARAITADTEDPAKEGLHYLLLDVCTMFLGWPSTFPADRRGSIARELQPVANGFLSFLVGLAQCAAAGSERCRQAACSSASAQPSVLWAGAGAGLPLLQPPLTAAPMECSNITQTPLLPLAVAALACLLKASFARLSMLIQLPCFHREHLSAWCLHCVHQVALHWPEVNRGCGDERRC